MMDLKSGQYNQKRYDEALAVWMNSCASLERTLQFPFWFFAISRFPIGKPELLPAWKKGRQGSQ
jgi:hypothetical protein